MKKQTDIEIVSIKVDDGYSGIIFERPAFKEMMKDIEDGKINCVIVKDLSRLGRDYIETGRYLRNTFPTYGVRFIAINDNFDTLKENNANSELAISIKSIFNDTYCRDISVKTRSALKVKREKGDFVGATPVYGYKKSNENKNLLVIDDYPSQIVKEIFNMKIEGVSAKQIADKLNEKGILSPIEYKKAKDLPYSKNGFGDKKNAKWSATTVIRILNDETYLGHLVQNKKGTINYKLKDLIEKPESEWIRVENTHDSIIKLADFDLVQKIMALDTRTSPHSDKVYLFSGILVCGSCGNRMTRKIRRYKDKVYTYYFCPTKKKSECVENINICDGSMIKESDLVFCISKSLKMHIDNVISIEKIVEEIKFDFINKKEIEKIITSIKENEIKFKEINKYKATLYENMINKVLTKGEYKTYKAKYDNDCRQIENAIMLLKEELEEIQSGKGMGLSWIEHFKKYSKFENIDRKSVVSLINSIIIKNQNEIQVKFNYQLEYEKMRDKIGGCEYYG